MWLFHAVHLELFVRENTRKKERKRMYTPFVLSKDISHRVISIHLCSTFSKAKRPGRMLALVRFSFSIFHLNIDIIKTQQISHLYISCVVE